MTDLADQTGDETDEVLAAPTPPATLSLRRRLLRLRYLPLLVILICIGCAVDAFLIEPNWVRIRPVDLADGKGSLRIVHISDLHYRGDADALRRLVGTINGIDADFVCFTGDLIENDDTLADEAMAILGTRNKPTYGIRGNHDGWAADSTERANAELRKTGGSWLDYQTVRVDQKGCEITGDVRRAQKANAAPNPGSVKRVLLIHNPDTVKRITAQSYDLILAGHTHGGQIRLPVIGNPIYHAGPYEQGLYRTDAGPLYVNPGIGTYWIRARFFCRPEITVLSF